MRSDDDDEPYGVFPELFHLRAATEKFPADKSLSGAYFEFFSGDSRSRMIGCKEAMPLEMRKRDCLARLNAGKIREQGIKVSIQLRVLHEYSVECPAYAGIHGVPKKPNEELCGMLASLALVELVDISTLT